MQRFRDSEPSRPASSSLVSNEQSAPFQVLTFRGVDDGDQKPALLSSQVAGTTGNSLTGENVRLPL